MKEQALAYWHGRSPRDRAILATLGAIAAFALAYAYLWQPVSEARLRLRGAVPVLRAQAAEIDAQAVEIRSLRAMAKPAPEGAQALLEQTAQGAGVRGELTQITPLGPNRVQVVANRIEFERWLAWVAQAQAALARVESAQITALPEPGQVKAQAIFVLPGR